MTLARSGTLRHGRRGSGRERGSALVEFALVFPFLAMLVFGAIDVGRVYRLHSQLKNAAREGASFAQFFPTQVSNAGACADPNNLTYAALNEETSASSTFTVTATNEATTTQLQGCNASTVAPGTRVQITVSAPFTVLTPIISVFTGSTPTIKATSHVVVQG